MDYLQECLYMKTDKDIADLANPKLPNTFEQLLMYAVYMPAHHRAKSNGPRHYGV